MRRLALLGLIAALVVGGIGFAGGRGNRERGQRGNREGGRRGNMQRVNGTLKSATLNRDTGKVELTIVPAEGDEEKTAEMNAQITVITAERNGETQVRMISAGGRAPRAREGMEVTQGTVVSAAVEGKTFTLKVKPAEGEEKDFSMPAKVTVMGSEADGKLTARMIRPGRGRRGGGRPGAGRGKRERPE